MSNLRPGPLFLTPQAVRGVLGIGYPKRTAEIAVKGCVNGAEKPPQGAQSSGGGVKPCQALDLSLCAAPEAIHAS